MKSNSNVIFNFTSVHNHELFQLKYVCLLFLMVISSLLMAGCVHEKPPVPFVPKAAYIVKDVEYGANYDTSGILQPLTLDIYVPAKRSVDQKFPLMVLLHAGSYQVGNKDWQKAQCKVMCDSGFVVASINYRLGWRNNGGCKGTAPSLAQAEYRGMQDANASLRFLVANAVKYDIDTTWIFIGGESAGAAIALNSSYSTDATVAFRNPEMANSLGMLHNSGNKLTNTYTIKGIFNKSGAISDSNLIMPANAIPTICFHGSRDQVVPFDKGYFLGCKKDPAFGSQCIYRQLLAANSTCVLYVKQDGPHMPPEFSPGYTMSKVVVFFRHVMKGKAKSGLFEE
jgi:acetyl esterase/lipase